MSLLRRRQGCLRVSEHLHALSRGAKLQARFNKLQAEAAKKQEQSAAQLAELLQRLDDALAAGQGTYPAALQDALDKVSAPARTASVMCQLWTAYSI